MDTKRMVRKQMYVLPAQNQLLKEKAAQEHKSEGELVRETLSNYLAKPTYNKIPAVDLSAWESEKAFIKSRTKSLRDHQLSGHAKPWKREDLYE